MKVNYTLPVTILKEGKRYVAYSPAIDLSTSGKTLNEARERFIEASSLFFEEIIAEGTVNDVLSSLGWEKNAKTWRPPIIVSQQSETIAI